MAAVKDRQKPMRIISVNHSTDARTHLQQATRRALTPILDSWAGKCIKIKDVDQGRDWTLMDLIVMDTIAKFGKQMKTIKVSTIFVAK